MKSKFEQVSCGRLFSICKIIFNATVHNKDFIKQKYNEQENFFEQNVDFLTKLKIISENDSKLNLKIKISLKSLEEFGNEILNKLLRKEGEIQYEVRTFLSKFYYIDGKFIYSAILNDRLKDSNVRNFLLELKFVSQQDNYSNLVINSNYIKQFENFVNRKAVSIEAFNRSQIQKQEIGNAAEIEVIKYETKRLTKINLLEGEIKHIGITNVTAGYDIKSFENYYDDYRNRVTRYIEVKAVPNKSYKFYWSKNEINLAKLLGKQYYIYLLPVIKNKKFDFSNMLKICDPYNSVFLSDNNWSKEVESYQFSLLEKEQ